jgi:hypothetical protein
VGVHGTGRGGSCTPAQPRRRAPRAQAAEPGVAVYPGNSGWPKDNSTRHRRHQHMGPRRRDGCAPPPQHHSMQQGVSTRLAAKEGHMRHELHTHSSDPAHCQAQRHRSPKLCRGATHPYRTCTCTARRAGGASTPDAASAPGRRCLRSVPSRCRGTWLLGPPGGCQGCPPRGQGCCRPAAPAGQKAPPAPLPAASGGCL